ncbi:hypothetical protein BRADI_3g31435v3 [Brachypodium distachyon]|uniref:Cation/H+ exchanger domain-containing protein n=1 Tax=Brachypodium distachyon TaxID=15368 RepID=A0A2K2D0D7_BRADI|nr:hypothetical protein BRADI_3g31435v3 [Brachypodium distachyon]
MRLPFACGISVAFVVCASVVPGANDAGYVPFLVFMGGGRSPSQRSPCQHAHILAELKLLTTPIGGTVLVAAAFNDGAAWVLLALVLLDCGALPQQGL